MPLPRDPYREPRLPFGRLQIEDVFIPSVLVATMLGELRFCLGATMAVWRGLLEEIGGLRSVGGVLADDHALGELVTKHKFEVELSRYVVGTTVPETSLPALWSHELRWADPNFALAPAGYAFSFLIYALPLAVLYLAVSGNLVWGLPLLGIIVVLRVGLHYLAGAALGGGRRGDVWLIPARDSRASPFGPQASSADEFAGGRERTPLAQATAAYGRAVASALEPRVCTFTPLSVRIVPSTRCSSTTALLRSLCA